VSHAQGGLYRGRRLGTFGDVSAASLMAGKSLAVGEAGMLTTDNLGIYERALAFGHYERYAAAKIETPYLKPWAGLPLGGVKHRMHQISAAVGIVQLKYYDERCAEIRRAMNRFWDLLEGVPGLRAHRTDAADPSSNMAGWYAARGLYVPEELGGLSVTRFCEAVRAEGAPCSPGCNLPLHTHPLFNDVDVYRHGRPTRLAHADRDVRQAPASLPRSLAIGHRSYAIPWFKHDRPDAIREYAEAFRKVAEHADELRGGDPGDPPTLGGWHFVRHK
jgi:dTDP-4-amino-4,6-dideoxygalactose transaminase